MRVAPKDMSFEDLQMLNIIKGTLLTQRPSFIYNKDCARDKEIMEKVLLAQQL